MGTKQAPGAFDCYKAARDDEVMFVLLARDPLAPMLVDLWADLRWWLAGDNVGSEEIDKQREAHQCAAAMRLQCRALGRIPLESVPDVLVRTLASYANMEARSHSRLVGEQALRVSTLDLLKGRQPK